MDARGWLVLGASIASACGSGGAGRDAVDVEPDAVLRDLPAEAPQEVRPEAGEAAADSPVAQDGALVDGACEDGAWQCSGDGYVLRTCVGGQWVETNCMIAERRLCENGACVDPWRYGEPTWGTCADHARATAETLAQKASYYDGIARRLHLHPSLKWVMGVSLPTKKIQCAERPLETCLAPAVSESEATWGHVQQWHTGENDGLWSGLYLASQAYRYAVTQSPEALQNLRTLLEGEAVRMRITGVPGVFTRQFIPPGVPGIACPTDDAAYVTDPEKDDNRWVQIRDDGCIWVIPYQTKQWTKTDHCGLDEFAGYCFLDNVSQDEYAGHMFALAAVWRLVPVPDLRETARDLIEQVGVHLMQNHLAIVDWDGRITEHGKLWATSFADTPGFLAAESLAFVKMAVEVSGREDLRDFYENCLLQRSGPLSCLPWDYEKDDPKPYTEFLPMMMAYVGEKGGCKSNFNNFSMVMSFLHDLLWFEGDPAVREVAQAALDTELMRANSPRALITHRNAWFNFIWAAGKALGPQSDGPAYQAVEEAICSLREFPASKHQAAKNTWDAYPHFCEGRLGDSQTEFPIPVSERCVRTFLWWASPYDREKCDERTWEIRQPADYLLAYWMGRYYGFIPETL